MRVQGAVTGLICVLLAAGCAGVKPPPSASTAQSAGPSAAAPSPAPAPIPQTTPTPAAATPGGAPAPEPGPLPVVPSTASQSAVKQAPPAAKAPPAVVPKASLAEPAKKERAVPDTARQVPAPLDLKLLEQRLKDTTAIGVLTKISLKNQVDDLLDQFRAFYQGKLKTTLAELRRSYDLLVLKVLALLQDSDPSLASAIVASREAIWGILADRAKFETL